MTSTDDTPVRNKCELSCREWQDAQRELEQIRYKEESDRLPYENARPLSVPKKVANEFATTYGSSQKQACSSDFSRYLTSGSRFVAPAATPANRDNL